MLIIIYIIKTFNVLSFSRIRSDHNIDNSVHLIQTWLSEHQDYYHSVDFQYEELPESFSDGLGVFEWSASHFQHVMTLKETALNTARKMWADYILVNCLFTYNFSSKF